MATTKEPHFLIGMVEAMRRIFGPRIEDVRPKKNEPGTGKHQASKRGYKHIVGLRTRAHRSAFAKMTNNRRVQFGRAMREGISLNEYRAKYGKGENV